MPSSMKMEKQLLGKGSEWPLFWGIFEVGRYDAYKDLNKKLRPDEAINTSRSVTGSRSAASSSGSSPAAS